MKKLIIATTIGTMALIPCADASTPPVSQTRPCCIGAEQKEGCTRWFCTVDDVETEYTDCTTCTESGKSVEKNLSYNDVCGTGSGGFESPVGKCVDAIIGRPECTPGTYGTGFNCKSCPEPGTSKSGATKIQDCYIPAGTVITDDTGTYKYTEDCYYPLGSVIIN